jgi:aspartate-semialdehyde dehydrogenase
MKKIGFVGWRGLVGSVLIDRILQENDFEINDYKNIYFFSTSQTGKTVTIFPNYNHKLQDAYNLDSLKEMDILLSCQGGDYTKKIHPWLRKNNWQGYWIDAASTLRLSKNSILGLDPVNINIIERGLEEGKKDFIGSNCTVSIMIMAIYGLLKENLVEWISNMTYQAISGAGTLYMKEMLTQMGMLSKINSNFSDLNILNLEKKLTAKMNEPDFTSTYLLPPLINNLIPWIGNKIENGQTQEEYKGMLEANKILENTPPILIDGTCVRVPVIRCHSEGLTIKLKKNISLNSIKEIIQSAHKWIKLIPNEQEETYKELHPLAISGTLSIAVGRVHKLKLGEKFLNVFCVGDQLLWGAAEPLRRMLKIILSKI